MRRSMGTKLWQAKVAKHYSRLTYFPTLLPQNVLAAADLARLKVYTLVIFTKLSWHVWPARKTRFFRDTFCHF